MNNPFSPKGDTVNIAVTGTAQDLALTEGHGTVRIANVGNQTVFIHFQTTATVSNGIPLLANSAEVFAKGAASSLSVIAAGTGSTLYVTTGEGV
jgi:hypothetical protein